MMEFTITNPNMYIDDEGSIIWDGLGITVKLTNERCYITSAYGDEICITNTHITHTQNSPTYEELYEHWLKTKGE